MKKSKIKKILIVSKWFYPENNPRAFRASELAKEFALQGHCVTVLTLKNKEIHDEYSKKYKFSIIDLGKLKWTNPSFGNSKIGYLLTRILHRLLSLSIEYPAIELFFMVANKIKKQGTFDLLISIAVPYPIHWGIAIAKTQKTPLANVWVADCGDPYMGLQTDTFRKWFYFKYVEKWFMRKADFITIPVEEGRQGYYSEFQKKIKIIPQGFKINERFENKFIANESPTFAYAGSFLPGIRDPRQFLEYLSSLRKEFKFIIYTKNQQLVKPFLSKMKGKLIIRDYIPREDLLNELGKMDFLVNFNNNTRIQQPSKLIDYAIIGRPILNIESKLSKNIVDEFLSGIYSNEFKILNIDRYLIENVVRQFLALSNN